MSEPPMPPPPQVDHGRRANRVPAPANTPNALRAFFQIASVLIVVLAITAVVCCKPAARSGPDASTSSASEQSGPASSIADLPTPDGALDPEPDDAESASASASAAADSSETTAIEPVKPEPDRALVAQAEAALDAASRDRERAEARASAAAGQLAQATAQAALDAARARKLAYLVRDPSTRIALASARGGFLRGERDKLEKEITALRKLPRPKSATILSKSPVARPATSEEYHFELRRGRVTFINLEQLMEMCKSDAQVRIRMADRPGEITSKVGPVGAFSLAYELVKATPGSVEELIQRKSVRFDLRAWELLPESENRGETYEGTRNPISEFARAVNRMSPSRSTVTMWVYPDSFALYRRLRADLIERGFSVAGRPLPDGMTIRGSPLGTQSAAQ
jgi:hypothetical protein